MTNYRLAFYVTAKPRTHSLAGLLAQGAREHGDVVEPVWRDKRPELLMDYDGVMCIGVAMNSKWAHDSYPRAGKFYVLFDKGYMDRENFLRMSVNAWQPLAYFRRKKRSPDRLLHIFSRHPQFKLQPRRTQSKDGPILIAGVCQAHCNFHDLGNANDFHSEVVRKIKREFEDLGEEREIIYRPNPSWYLNHRDEFKPIPGTTLSTNTPFEHDLRTASLLVTHGSSACLAALRLGIPTMVLGLGITRYMGLGPDGYAKVLTPSWPDSSSRYQFFADMAYCQWTYDEIQDGTAWANLREVFAMLEEDKDISEEVLIPQYREMHAGRYFRGLTCTQYIDVMKELVNQYRPIKTMLDYGSGKGEQYSNEKFRLHKVLGVEATCFDPGVEEYQELPDGPFDLVICCDVMEHIPENLVQKTLCKVIERATKVVFFSIATQLAKKLLPDGRNCHLTVRNEAWWDAQIKLAAEKCGKKDLPIKVVYSAVDG